MRKNIFKLLLGTFCLVASSQSWANTNPFVTNTSVYWFVNNSNTGTRTVWMNPQIGLSTNSIVILTTPSGEKFEFEVEASQNKIIPGDTEIEGWAKTYINSLNFWIQGQNSDPSQPQLDLKVRQSVPFDLGIGTVLGVGAIAAARRSRSRHKQLKKETIS